MWTRVTRERWQITEKLDCPKTRPPRERSSLPRSSCRSCTTQHQRINPLWDGLSVAAKAILWPHHAPARHCGDRTGYFCSKGIYLDSGVPDDCLSLCSRLPALDCRSLLANEHLGAVVQRAMSVLNILRRWRGRVVTTPPQLTKRVVGIIVVLRRARALVMPIH